MLVLLFLFNPVVRSLRAIEQASETPTPIPRGGDFPQRRSSGACGLFY
jgi:hypothetical protein